MRTATRNGLAALAAAVLTGALVAIPAQAAPQELISSDATHWQYLDTGVDPAGEGDVLSWTAAGYDDSSWGNALGSFGSLRGSHADVGGNAVRTHLNQYYEGTTTNIEAFFFRTGFELTAAELDDIALLTGDVRHDDALAVWVNGTKVAGVLDDGFDPSLGNMQYLGASNGSPILSTITVPQSALVEGTNTVAVAVYQDRDTSSDIYFDFESLTMVDANAPIEITDLVLNVGANETERNVAWYTSLPADGEVQWAPASAMSGDDFPEAQAASAAPVDHGQTYDGRYYHHATIDGLAENSEYVYRVGGEQGWSQTHTFSTGEFGAADFSFLMFGDPQLGSSGNLESDTAGWENTLAVAADMFPETAFIQSVGDQVEHAASEEQYAAFLRTDHVREVPLATVNGNHDVNSTAYRTHFFMPGLDETYGAARNASQSGGNAWYLHNDMLVMVLNSNNMDVSTHEAFIEKVLAEQGDNAAWHVVTFHHSAFSVAQHSATGSIVNFRNAMSPMLSEQGIDLVMMGHDHSYTRTFLMEGREPVASADTGEVFPEEGQTLYITGNSSSGSKYYSVRSPDQIAAADPNGFDYAQAIWQERVPSFTNLEVQGDVITATTYRTDTRAVIDDVVLHRAGAEEDPTPEPPTAPSEDDLTADLEGLVTAPDSLIPGEPVLIGANPALAGEQVAGFLFSESFSLGAGVLDADGLVTLTVPTDAPLGSHRLALYGANGDLIGWTSVMVMAADAGDGSGPGAGDGEASEDGDGTGTGSGSGSGTDSGAGWGAIGQDGVLSSTGAQVAGLALAATALLGLGFAATAFARRRGREDSVVKGAIANA